MKYLHAEAKFTEKTRLKKDSIFILDFGLLKWEFKNFAADRIFHRKINKINLRYYI
jgi:hypothetical protein